MINDMIGAATASASPKNNYTSISLYSSNSNCISNSQSSSTSAGVL